MQGKCHESADRAEGMAVGRGGLSLLGTVRAETWAGG